MNRTVILKGCAGLGNRLITLTKAIEYCQTNNRKLVIDWNDGLYFEEGYNFFNDFFTLENISYSAPNSSNIIDELQIENRLSVYPVFFEDKLDSHLYDHYVQVKNDFLVKLFFKFPKILPNKFGGMWTINEKFKGKPALNIFSLLVESFSKNSFPLGGNLSNKINADLVVFADYRPFFNKDLFNRSFRINEKIISLIFNKIDQESVARSIGVHVRATDMQPTISIDLLINNILKRFPGQSVFLATDNPEIEQKFVLAGLRVLTVNKKFSSNQYRGLHHVHTDNQNYDSAHESFLNGIADMFLLSRTSFLLYQGNSSFSILADAMRTKSNSSEDWLNLDE